MTVIGHDEVSSVLRFEKGTHAIQVESNNFKVEKLYIKSEAYGYVLGVNNGDTQGGKPNNAGLRVNNNIENIEVEKCTFDGFNHGIFFLYENKNVIISSSIFRNMRYLISHQ